MANNPIVAALPISTPAVQTLLRNFAVQRLAYVLADADDMRNLVAVDPTTGAAIQDVMFLGRDFHYDSTDTTSVHDGVSVLVSSEGRRYKLASNSDVLFSYVKDNTVATPPGSPALGDTYLVATAGTGAWSGKDGTLAVYTARGWEFVTPGVGRLIYVSAGTNIDTYYRRKADGTWAAGIGAISVSANTIPVSALINVGRTSFIVENQTTNAPPVSPSVGNGYIIGPSPTGAWAGKAAQLAICEAASSWTYYVPTNGYQAYDKALNNNYLYTGSAWVSAGGAMVGTPQSVFTTSGSTTTGNSSVYSGSATVAPTTTNKYIEDSVTLTYTAKKTGARLRFWYQYWPATTTAGVVALFRDSEANAVDWMSTSMGSPSMLMFEVTAGDASSHVYKIRLLESGSGVLTAPTRRRFSVEEFA